MHYMLPIPALESSNLTPVQKMVYSIIYTHTCVDGYCNFNNAKIAGILSVSENSARDAVKALIRCDFISDDKIAAKESGARHAWVGQVM